MIEQGTVGTEDRVGYSSVLSRVQQGTVGNIMIEQGTAGYSRVQLGIAGSRSVQFE